LRKLPRLLFAAILALTVLLPPSVVPATANGGSQAGNGGTRTLYLHHTHTGETAYFTFKRNGQYDQAVLRQMNVFLADWRTKDQIKMDPALFDLLWEVYQEVGATQPYNIVSSYRAPKTNAMLRAKSSAVAENSQHMRGKAMDVFIPGVNLAKLRATAMRHQVGGVGYYPTSGSPFVHMDTGNVRAWPRMTRAQLEKVFPDGKTLHLPVDGKPLSSSGRAYAQAQWTKCHTVPCDGRITFDTNPGIMIANNAGEIAPIPADKPGNLYSGTAEVLLASAEMPVQRQVQTIAVAAPIPVLRPKTLTTASADGDYSKWDQLGAPVPAVKSPRIKLATRSPLGEDDGQTALAALTALEAPAAASDDLVAAYAPANQEPGAELALKMIIERETTASLPDLPMKQQQPLDPGAMQTASLGDTKGLNGLSGMFDQTFSALSGAGAPARMADALEDLVARRQSNASIELRDIELVAPEIDHVNETLVQPVEMETAFWAEMTEAEGYLEKTTELGPLTGRVAFIPADAAIPAYDHFVTGTPLLVAGL
jgi:uncharacterized protein YcbK (DUF882 family)